MKRLRVGLVGAGLVGQAEHAFYLWEERERFDFVGLADASAAVRDALGARYRIKELHADLPSLIKAAKLDALVIAAPDPFHPDLAVTALEAGLHVLCEKPLSLTLSGCDRIKAARDKAGKVLQVAYMKRHDPAFLKALDLLPKMIDEVKLISVEVNDPDQDPFVAHLPMTLPSDISSALKEQFKASNTAQLQEAAGRVPSEAGCRALANGFLSALVHDVAVVHGLLLHLGHDLPPIAQAAFFDGGRGVQLAADLPGGGRISMTHLNLPGVPDYTERISIYCADRIIELTFPSPYLRHFPTKLTLRQDAGDKGLETHEFRVSYEEAFREQLRAFHAAACGEGPVKTPLEQARRDVEFLISAYRKAEP
jgi:predicted dehydrogenase